MKFPGTQRYTWVERSTMREVSCLRISSINSGQCSNQDHSMLRAALEPLGHPTCTRLKLMYKDLLFNSNGMCHLLWSLSIIPALRPGSKGWCIRAQRNFHLWSGTSLFFCRASNFSFTLAQWAMARANSHSTKYERNKLILAQGKQSLRAAFPTDKLEFKCFLSPCACTCMSGGGKCQVLG